MRAAVDAPRTSCSSGDAPAHRARQRQTDDDDHHTRNEDGDDSDPVMQRVVQEHPVPSCPGRGHPGG